MAHVWWHNCLTVGDPTGKKPEIKIPEGTRGNVMCLLRFPHEWSEARCHEASARLDALALEMVNVVRQSQESIVFNPIQGKPTDLP